MRRDLAPIERQTRAQQPCRAGCGFQMSELSLDRSDGDRDFGTAQRFIGVACSLDFEGVAEFRGGAMSLEIGDLVRVDTVLSGRAHNDIFCASGLGVVSELACPSWLTAVAWIRAISRPPGNGLSVLLRKTKTTPPSAITVPFACLENVSQRPVFAAGIELAEEAATSADRIRLTPPTSARSHSFERKALTAR